MSKQEFYVAMTIEGSIVPSSAVFNGTEKQCVACAGRMNRSKTKHRTVSWVVLPCIQ